MWMNLRSIQLSDKNKSAKNVYTGYHFYKTQIQAELSNISFRDAYICDKKIHLNIKRQENAKHKMLNNV